MTTLSPGLKSLLIRLTAFLVLFIVTTGIVGPWVVTSKLLFNFHFFVYGNIGKMVILGSIVFLFLTRKKLVILSPTPYEKRNILFLLLAAIMMPLFFISGNNLLLVNKPTDDIPLFLLTHGLLLALPFFTLLGTFGVSLVLKLVKLFQKEILICCSLSIILYFAIFQVWKLWPYLSAIVLAAVKFLFSLTFAKVRVIPPLTLIVNSFGVRIEQACSGLDSLFMFSVLYWIIAAIEWKDLNKKKIFLLYIPALIGLFIVNIFRVYSIILIGVLYSPELALQLFHTYAGMVFFILYFGIFMKMTYKWMKT